MKSEKIKVLMIISKLSIGGAEKVARDIGLYADKEKYQFDYLVFGDEIGAYEKELTACGCNIVRFPEPSESFSNYIKNLKSLVEKNRYDVIHAHTMFNIGWAMLVGKICGVPVRVSHSHSALLEKRNIKTRVYEALMRFFILTFSTDIVACGVKAGNRLYGKNAFKKRGKLILNGINTDDFAFDNALRSDMRKKLGIEAAFVIGHAGHFAPVKNQAFLIECMPEILKIKPNAVLLLLGDGEEKEKIENKIKGTSLDGKVIFTGNVTNVGDYLNAMDVFAFPSLYEGTPLSIIEVQSNGLPCVISNTVPDDVFLTDLICPLPLSQKDAWVEKICGASRKNPEEYSRLMKETEFTLSTALGKFYSLYKGGK